MSSTNPFDPLHESDREEGLFPGAQSLNNVETNPPRNYELMGMETTPTSTDLTQPSDITECTRYANGPLTQAIGFRISLYKIVLRLQPDLSPLHLDVPLVCHIYDLLSFKYHSKEV